MKLSYFLPLFIGCLFASNLVMAQPVITIDTIIDATCNASADGSIQISVSGNPNFSYQWSNGATTEDISGLFANSFVVTVTDGFGLSTVSSVLTVNAPAVLNVNTDSLRQVSCAGNLDGAVYISILGGVTPYSYIWGDGTTTQDATALSEGSVGLTVTDANGCTSSPKSIALDSIAPIQVSIDSLGMLSCNAANDGFINATAVGGVGNLSYLWSSGQTTADISGLAANSYTLTVTDSNACTIVSGPYSITQPILLSLNVDSIVSNLCNGSNLGAVFITSTGGTNPYNYLWSNGSTTEDNTGLIADTYFVTLTDANGCQVFSGPQVISEPPALIVAVDTIINQLCAGQATASVDLNVSGGTPNYTYFWSNGGTTQDITGLYSGVNDVTVTDANGCTASAKSIFVDSINPINFTVDSTRDVSCNGANDGAIFVSVFGGVGNYSYNWSNGATTQNLNGLSGANYSLTVTDSNNCVLLSGPILINEPTVLVLTLDSLQSVDCNGNGNGAVFTTVSGGTTAYTYNWSNAATTEDITGLNGGTFMLTVTDANGCTDSIGPLVVNEPPPLLLLLDSIQSVDCTNNANAAILVTVVGGSPSYSYQWSNTATTQDISGLNGGLYSLTVTDSLGCTVDTNYVVNEPSLLLISLDSTNDVSCNAFADGAIFLSDTGGTAPISYQWSNGATSQDLNSLSGNSYQLTATDANGCTATVGPFVVNEPAGMTINLDTIIAVSCNAAADGAINLTTVGGAPTYSFLWSNGLSTEDIINLDGGSYSITVTDINNCTVSAGPYLVAEASAITINLDTAFAVSCAGLADAALSISTSGGVAPYSYLWSNAATTQDINGLIGGSYSVTVTDSLGCSATDTAYTVFEPDSIALNLDSLLDVTCFGFADGAIYLSDTGGTLPISYQWSNGATTQDIQALSGNSYQLSITDANGCNLVAGPFSINEPIAINSTLDSIVSVSCNAAADGSINLTTLGGTPNYTFLWSDGSSTEDIANLNGGSYTVTVTDANNCSISFGPYLVNEQIAITLTLDSLSDVSCAGLADGQLWTTVNGGIGPYNYLWSNAATDEDITGLSAGSYSLTVTDSVGCSILDSSFIVSEPLALSIQIDSIQNISCNAGSNAAIFISAAGGTPSYTYLWSNGATNASLSGLSQGNYNLSVSDSNNCQATTLVTITEPSALSVTATASPISCSNSSDGIARVFASGGSPGYNFVWDTQSGAQTTDFAVGLLPGNYCVTVSDQNNCSDSICVTILPTTHVFTAFGDTTICEGDTIPLSATSGFSYAWTPASSLNDSTLQNPLAFPVISTLYRILADTLSGVNIIYNGDFEDGVAGFNSDYVIGTGGTFGQLSNPGTYAINTNAANTHNNFSACTDHTTSTGNFMIVNGATIAGQNVWCQTVSVTPNTTYQLSTWITSVESSNPALLQFSVNGLSLGGSFNASSTTCVWNQFFELWNSGTDTVATICIINQNTQQGGNDFGIDDIVFTAICQLEDSVQVTVNPKPNIQTTTTAPVCVGDSFSIVASGGQSYNWLGPNGFFSSSPSLLINNSSLLDSGSYLINVSSALGCIDSARIDIDVFPNPALTISGQDVSCFGLNDATAVANANNGTSPYTYLWSDNQTTQTAVGLGATTYQLTLSDANNCTDTASVILSEPIAISTTTASIDVACYGLSTGSASVNVLNGGSFNYQWSSNASSQTSNNASGLAAGAYQVTSTDTTGCFVVDTIVLNQADSFQNIQSSATLVDCLIDSTGSLAVSLNGGVPGYSFLWSDGQQGSTAVGLTAGVYTVTITDANNCTLLITDTVNASFQPQVAAFVGQNPIIDTTINWGDLITLDVGNDQSADSVSYLWEQLSNISGLNLDNPTATQTTVMPEPDSNEVYTILLTATSADGCQDTATVQIRVNIETLLGMPDAFTPNGDGFNDYFRPAGLDDQFILEFKIYNRWGQVVFDGTDTSSSWDGTYRGVEQPTEVYIYLLHYQLPGQIPMVMKGEMTLIR